MTLHCQIISYALKSLFTENSDTEYCPFPATNTGDFTDHGQSNLQPI